MIGILALWSLASVLIGIHLYRMIAIPLFRMIAVTRDTADELRREQTDWQGTAAVSENVRVHGEGK